MIEYRKPTEAELEILLILWERGPMTVRELHDILMTHKASGYTTTLKLMQIMTEKGILTRRKEGKSHIYKANIPQQETQQAMIDKLVDSLFQGSAMKMVMQALGSKKTTRKELDQIRQYLDQLEGGSDEH